MRTLHLIKSLSPLELKEVEHILTHHKRQNLLSIFRYLKKKPSSNNAPSIKELLSEIFNQECNKQNELQLRNKLTRLNEVLYTYLRETEFKTQAKKNESISNWWLAQAYRSRNVPMLKNDLGGFIAQASKDFMFDELAAMMRLNAFGKKQSFIKSINDVEEWQQIELNRFLLNYTAAEAYKAVYYENENTQSQEKRSVWERYQAPDYRFDFKKLNKLWYFRLFENFRLALLPENKSRSVYYYKKAEDALKDINSPHVLLHNMRAFIFLNIAQALAKENRFEEALAYQEKHFDDMKREGAAPSSVTLVNYMVILMQLNRLVEAKRVYLENRKIIDVGRFAKPVQFLYAAACLFTNDENEAINTLHSISPIFDHEKLTIRNLFLVSFIMRKEWNLAATEAGNLKRAIAGFENNDTVRDIAKVTIIMSQYVSAINGSKRTQKSKLDAVNSSAGNVIDLFTDDPVQSCILKWIVKQTL